MCKEKNIEMRTEWKGERDGEEEEKQTENGTWLAMNLHNDFDMNVNYIAREEPFDATFFCHSSLEFIYFVFLTSIILRAPNVFLIFPICSGS